MIRVVTGFLLLFLVVGCMSSYDKMNALNKEFPNSELYNIDNDRFLLRDEYNQVWICVITERGNIIRVLAFPSEKIKYPLPKAEIEDFTS